jgi:hypothetical protein
MATDNATIPTISQTDHQQASTQSLTVADCAPDAKSHVRSASSLNLDFTSSLDALRIVAAGTSGPIAHSVTGLAPGRA